MFQESHESIDIYFRNFKARWDTLGKFGGLLGHQPGLIEERAQEVAKAANQADPIDADVEAATEQVNKEMKTSLMLVLANRGRFESLRKYLANKYILGEDRYPSTVDGLMGVLRNYKPPKNAGWPPRDPRNPGNQDNDGLQFIQKEEKPNTDEGAIMAQEKKVRFNSMGEKNCFNCGADDH